jgi:hypothetical protein
MTLKTLLKTFGIIFSINILALINSVLFSLEFSESLICILTVLVALLYANISTIKDVMN